MIISMLGAGGWELRDREWGLRREWRE